MNNDDVAVATPSDGNEGGATGAVAPSFVDEDANHTFRRTTEIDAHHAFARYGCELVDANGTVAVGGTDFAELDDDGQPIRPIGFFAGCSSCA